MKINKFTWEILTQGERHWANQTTNVLLKDSIFKEVWFKINDPDLSSRQRVDAVLNELARAYENWEPEAVFYDPEYKDIKRSDYWMYGKQLSADAQAVADVLNTETIDVLERAIFDNSNDESLVHDLFAAVCEIINPIAEAKIDALEKANKDRTKNR